MTRTRLSVFSTRKETFSETFALRPPSYSHATPALWQASRQGASAAWWVSFTSAFFGGPFAAFTGLHRASRSRLGDFRLDHLLGLRYERARAHPNRQRRSYVQTSSRLCSKLACPDGRRRALEDRKSTRLNSSH